MILNKDDIEYLKELSVIWVLKFKEPITEGTYRWYLFMYSNLYECVPGYPLKQRDKEILKSIFKKLLPEHRLTWVRHRMYEAKDYIKGLCVVYKGSLVEHANSIREFKVAAYLDYCLATEQYIIDDYMIDTFGSFKIIQERIE